MGDTFGPKGFSGLLAFCCVSSGAFHFFGQEAGATTHFSAGEPLEHLLSS